MTGKRDVKHRRNEKIGRKSIITRPKPAPRNERKYVRRMREGKRWMAYRGLYVSLLDRGMVGEFC